MIIGRLTAKSQTTVPRAVRLALGLKPGDQMSYELDGDRAVLKRMAVPEDAFVNNFASFTEWASDADEEAYRDL